MKTAGFLLLAALIAAPASAQSSKIREAKKKEAAQQQKADFWDARYTESAIDAGYRDGYEQGKLDFVKSRRDYTVDSKYRMATRGYQTKYGAQGHYQNYYREGFRRGYEDAIRTADNAKRQAAADRARQKQKR